MADEAEALTALAKILAPHCRVTRLSGGALIADWKRTRFLGMTPADVRVLTQGNAQERAEVVTGLVRAGCATGRRREHTDADVRLWLLGTHLLIRTMGFGRVLRLLSVAAPEYARRDSPPAEQVGRLKQAVQSRSSRSCLVNGDCKSEAVTAFALLRRRGWEAVLHVGVREHPFAMHTWVSSAGLCIPDADPRGHAFTPVLSIGRGGP
ncbi:lasso peptide biosynthesis B2 protein [Streptomyces flaveolus]|uniref:lasso peptide biosynthesis B2 protein n=1 Tax=Streptomyces flaveolus TaxID=67297 RepID=UPI0036CFD126